MPDGTVITNVPDELFATKAPLIGSIPIRVPGTDIGTDIPVSPGVEEYMIRLGQTASEAVTGLQQRYHQAADWLSGGKMPDTSSAPLQQQVESERAMVNRDFGPSSTVGDLSRNLIVAAAVPGGATIKGAAGAGAVIGLMNPNESGSEALMQAGLSAGMSAGGAKLFSVIGKHVKMRRELKLEADELIKEADKWGIPLKYGDIAKGGAKQFEEWLQNIPFVGTHGFMVRQQQATTKAITDFVHGNGGMDRNFAKVISEAAGTRWTKVVTLNNKLYQRVRDEARDTVIPIHHFAEYAERRAAEIRDPSVKAIFEKFAEYGKRDWTFDTLLTAKESLRKEVRDTITSFTSGTGDAVKSRFAEDAIELRNMLDLDVTRSMNIIGGKAMHYWRTAQGFYKTNVAPFKKGDFASMHDKLIDEQKVVGEILSKLSSKNEAQARVMWGQLPAEGKEAARGMVLRNAYNKAHVKAQDGTEYVSATKFASAIDEMGKTLSKESRVNMMFPGQLKAEVDGFTKLLARLKETAGVGSSPKTGYATFRHMLFATVLAGGALGVGYQHPTETGLTLGGAGIMTLMFTTQTGRYLLLKARTATTPEMLDGVIEEAAKQIPKLMAQTPKEFMQ